MNDKAPRIVRFMKKWSRMKAGTAAAKHLEFNLRIHALIISRAKEVVDGTVVGVGAY
jgi:hypothetical protein